MLILFQGILLPKQSLQSDTTLQLLRVMVANVWYEISDDLFTRKRFTVVGYYSSMYLRGMSLRGS